MTLSTPDSGHALAIPAAPCWSGAYNETDMVIIRVEGLIHAAFFLADEHPKLGDPSPQTAALDAVLRALRKASEDLTAARREEYAAGLGLERARVSACSP